MKKTNFLFLIIILVTTWACKPNGKNNLTISQVRFDKDTFDFKTLKKGQKADIIFKMTNIGTTDAIIKKTSVGCGCTKVDSVKNLLKPGETASLKLVYDSKDDTGKVFKTFVVETNTVPKLSVLYIKGNVK